jgi:pyruvate dehydrogenase E2 component (dihydrolipoamide acetyltransferase)
MALRKKYAPAYEKKGTKLTVTSFTIKAVVAALKKYPQFNVSLDESANELVLKEYFHISIAVDTESGLIVPVLRDADKKSLLDISVELETLAEKTRARKVNADDLKGGSFTISNLGGIGGSYFTPIVNKPEVAILGVGRGVSRAMVIKDKIEARLMLPLALSYDHRVIDGADGVRFIREICAALENFEESQVKI